MVEFTGVSDGDDASRPTKGRSGRKNGSLQVQYSYPEFEVTAKSL